MVTSNVSLHASSPKRSVAVGAWLCVLAAFIIGQVMLGGITRLTGSGLSITEWRPVTGAIPPLSDSDWDSAFSKYKQIPQFEKINSHFTLSDFKKIYFWEWLHRFWGRLLGVVFIIPLIVFWKKGLLKGRKTQLFSLFALGALQGFIGWFMVASGLAQRVYVSHLRLAVHLIAALILLAWVVWLALRELHPRTSPHLPRSTLWLLGLLTLQLVYGAFMAGLHAAPFAPSWPSINGVFLPRAAFDSWTSVFNDPITVHFIHRNLAYLLSALVLIDWIRRRSHVQQGPLRWVQHLPLLVVALQLALGVGTVLGAAHSNSFVPLAAAHQLGAVALMVALILAGYFSPKDESSRNISFELGMARNA